MRIALFTCLLFRAWNLNKHRAFETWPARLGIRSDEDKMKTVVCAALIAAFVTPAFAASEFYVVQNVKTKKCSVESKKPTDTTKVTVMGDTVYKTKKEAQGAVKTVCTQ